MAADVSGNITDRFKEELLGAIHLSVASAAMPALTLSGTAGV